VADGLDRDTPATGSFPATRWSLVVDAGGAVSSQAREALATLCAAYWYPIYVLIRRKGYDPHQAQDLTQSYFARLLEKGVIARADRAKGRFRAFLRVDCQHFLIDQHRRKAAGGPVTRPISIDARDAEGRYLVEPADGMTPDRLFDHAWAVTLLDRVLDLVAAEYACSGKAELFDRLKGILTQGKGSVPAAKLAAQLGKTEAAVHVAAHRLRKRYREVLQEQIAATLDNPSETDDEIQALFDALRP
jgi:DNA-directed RNA polymerase specialized sigma24 family protein